MSHPSFWTFLRRGYGQVRTHGLRLLWWRYFRRPEILRFPPEPCPPDASLEVHMQVCARDWLNGLWTLRSFAHVISDPFRLVLLTDGSLTATALAHYRRCFPGIIIPERSRTEQQLRHQLADIAPTLLNLWLRGQCFTLPKVLDSAMNAKNSRIMQLDPDVLFFRHPVELLQRLRDSKTHAVWNVPVLRQHADGSFTHSPNEIEHITGLRVPVPFQTGLGVWSPNDMPWFAAEKLLRESPLRYNLCFMLDQTLLALHAAAHGWALLPPSRYAIDPVPNMTDVVARHYFAKTRDLMYIEGLPTLTKMGLRSS